MLMTPEGLRNSWQAVPHCISFDPKAVNWSDLLIHELNPELATTLKQEGLEQISKSQLPEIGVYGARDLIEIHGVKRVEDLPAELRNYKGRLYNLGNFMEQVVISNLSYGNRDLFDPEDQLYFKGQDQTLGTDFVIAIRHQRSLDSNFWKQMWVMQVDFMLDLTPIHNKLNLPMVSSLIPPQRATSELESNIKGGILHREALKRNDPEKRAPMWVDGKLLYSHFLVVNREQQYPMTEEFRALVITSIAQIMRNLVVYEAQYRADLLNLFSKLGERGITFTNQFAAKEV